MKKIILAPLFLSLLAINSAFAGIITQSSPSSLERDSLESNTDIFLLTEVEDYIVGSDPLHNGALEVDLLTSSGLLGGPLGAPPSGQSIAAGSLVNSYLFHFDAIGSETSFVQIINGEFTFATEILGLIWSGPLDQGGGVDNLTKTDFLATNSQYFQAPSTDTAGAGRGRGLEDTFTIVTDNTRDFFKISDDLKTIEVNFRVQPKFSDQLRIITAAVKVPEPAAIWLLGPAILLLLGSRRRN